MVNHLKSDVFPHFYTKGTQIETKQHWRDMSCTGSFPRKPTGPQQTKPHWALHQLDWPILGQDSSLSVHDIFCSMMSSPSLQVFKTPENSVLSPETTHAKWHHNPRTDPTSTSVTLVFIRKTFRRNTDRQTMARGRKTTLCCILPHSGLRNLKTRLQNGSENTRQKAEKTDEITRKINVKITAILLHKQSHGSSQRTKHPKSCFALWRNGGTCLCRCSTYLLSLAASHILKIVAAWAEQKKHFLNIQFCFRAFTVFWFGILFPYFASAMGDDKLYSQPGDWWDPGSLWPRLYTDDTSQCVMDNTHCKTDLPPKLQQQEKDMKFWQKSREQM